MRSRVFSVSVLLATVLLASGCSTASTDAGDASPPANTPPATSPAASAPPTCATNWGTDARKDVISSRSEIVGVHAEQHDCFDRLIVDLTPSASGYFAEYVDEILAEGSGKHIDVSGGAILKLVLAATTYDIDTGTATIEFADPLEVAGVSDFTALRQVAFAGSFEGQTTFGVGLASRSDFRVTVVDAGNQSQLLLDIAH